MPKIKLNLARLSIPEKLRLADTIIKAMQGNPNFTNPNPSLVQLQDLWTAANTKTNKSAAADLAVQQAITERNTAIEALVAGLNAEAAYVESISGGDTAKIQSAGMEVRAEASPVGLVDQPEDLATTAGDSEGEIDLSWDKVRGASSYEIQTSPDPITATSWTHRTSVTKSSVTLNGLATGSRCWFRVRAVGSAGPGAWSDPAVKTVP